MMPRATNSLYSFPNHQRYFFLYHALNFIAHCYCYNIFIRVSLSFSAGQGWGRIKLGDEIICWWLWGRGQEVPKNRVWSLLPFMPFFLIQYAPSVGSSSILYKLSVAEVYRGVRTKGTWDKESCCMPTKFLSQNSACIVASILYAIIVSSPL